MAILFRCQCTKKLAAREAFAGRQLKCPACTRLLTIPRQASFGDFVRFSCSCGKKMKARQTDAGAAVDCPLCGLETHIPRHRATMLAPAADSAALPRRTAITPTSAPTEMSSWTTPIRSTVEGPSPSSNPRLSPHTPRSAVMAAPARLGHGNDTLGGSPPAAWRDDAIRKSTPPPPEPRVKPLPWLTIMFLLALALLAAEYFFSKDSLAGPAQESALVNDLALTPVDTVELVTLRFGQLWKKGDKKSNDTAMVRYAEDLFKDIKWKDAFEDDVERVTLVWMPDARANLENQDPQTFKNDTCVIVHTRAPGQPHEVVKVGLEDRHRSEGKGKKAKGPATSDFTQQSFFKHTVYASAELDKAFYLPDDRVVVFSTVNGIRHFIQAYPELERPHPLALVIDAAAKHDLVIGYNTSRFNAAGAAVHDMHARLVSSNLAWMTVDETRAPESPALTGILTLMYDAPGQAFGVTKQTKTGKIGGEKPKVMAWQQAKNKKVEEYSLVFGYAPFTNAIWEEFASMSKSDPKLVFTGNFRTYPPRPQASGWIENAIDIILLVFLGVVGLGCVIILCFCGLRFFQALSRRAD